MSQTITKVSGIQHSYERISTWIPFTVALSAETYATASGGISVDLSTPIALLGAGTAQPLSVNDVVAATGTYISSTLTGNNVVCTVVKSSGIPTGAITVRLLNAESAETADGAKTGTLTLYVLFGQGSRSYNT